MNEPVFYSVQGTSRKCAMPNFDYLYEKYSLQRNYRVRYLYDEYAQACEQAGERPYAFSSFMGKKAQWKRGRVTKTLPPWYPGERLYCCWSKLPDTLQHVEPDSPRLMFVAVLPYSEYTFVCLSKSRSRESWLQCCMKAYHFFGGVPHVTECQPFIASSTKSTEFTLQAFSAHYRTVLFQPCPKTFKTASKRAKPLMTRRDSRAARMLRKRLTGLPAMSTAELDTLIAKLLDEFNNEDGSRGASRRKIFETREAPQMLSLPEKDYDMAVWAERTVGSDYHFVHDKTRYSIPYQYADEKIIIRATEDEVEAYSTGVLIAKHRIPKGGAWKKLVTDPAHRPPNHAFFAKRLDTRFMTLARNIGPATGAIMKEVLFRCEKSDSRCYRPCKNLLDLQNMPSGITLEEACSKVLEDELEMTVESVAAIMRTGTR